MKRKKRRRRRRMKMKRRRSRKNTCLRRGREIGLDLGRRTLKRIRDLLKLKEKDYFKKESLFDFIK